MDSDDGRRSILVAGDPSYTVRLEGFEGPLELLLHLIRKHKYDIYDIPISSILDEYLGVLDAMQEFDIDHAGEFLVMAATLAQIKSRMLLPRPLAEGEGEEGEDPRAELVRRLLDYERFREAALELSGRPQLGRDVFAREGSTEAEGVEKPEVAVEADLLHLLMAFREVLKEAGEEFIHEVSRRRMTTQEAMTEILDHFRDVEPGGSIRFRDLFPGHPTRDRVVALFMGILELVKLRALKVSQTVTFGEIRLSALPAEEEE